jgi:uncharacterized membrane protein YhaH (DUF805 family)
MDFQQAVKSCFAKYATFPGRAARSEFWYWQLFLTAAGVAVAIVDAVLGLHSKPLGLIFYLVTLVPTLAVGARRLHDTGRSAWWLLLWLVPLIGWIVLLIWLCTKGSNGYNGYGPDPLPRESTDTRHRVKAQDVPPIRAII